MAADGVGVIGAAKIRSSRECWTGPVNGGGRSRSGLTSLSSCLTAASSVSSSWSVSAALAVESLEREPIMLLLWLAQKR